MRYKYINEHKIEPAPKTLTVIKDGVKKVLLTPNAEAYEEQGYFEPVVDIYPDDGYVYTPVYEKSGLGIIQHWERGEKIETLENNTDPTTAFMETVSKSETNSFAKLRAAAQTFLDTTEGVI